MWIFSCICFKSVGAASGHICMVRRITTASHIWSSSSFPLASIMRTYRWSELSLGMPTVRCYKVADSSSVVAVHVCGSILKQTHNKVTTGSSHLDDLLCPLRSWLHGAPPLDAVAGGRAGVACRMWGLFSCIPEDDLYMTVALVYTRASTTIANREHLPRLPPRVFRSHLAPIRTRAARHLR